MSEPKFARGGRIPSATGSPTSDDIPAIVSRGCGYGYLVTRRKGSDGATVYPVEFGEAEPWVPPEYEPSVADRLRTLADAEIEAAKDGSRTQKAAAKAAATAYRLAADMIEEDE